MPEVNKLVWLFFSQLVTVISYGSLMVQQMKTANAILLDLPVIHCLLLSYSFFIHKKIKIVKSENVCLLTYLNFQD